MRDRPDTTGHGYHVARAAAHLVALDQVGPPFTSECALSFYVSRSALATTPPVTAPCGMCRLRLASRQRRSA